MYILFFFLAHWFLSLFCQTFFLHRYASHKMFTMSPFWERFFYFLTFVTQGSSFLNPRAYAILHRMHHAYSDTEEDPHSPHFFKDVWHMTMHTKDIYLNYAKHNIAPKKAFDGNFPEWRTLDKISNMWGVRILFMAAYVLFYLEFVPPGAGWMFLLLPVHFFMGPIHGAIVNWCGHKYGYSNYDNGDKSRNTLPIDVFLLGELMQNNHHKHPNRLNFANRKFEIDPAFILISIFGKLGIIKIRKR
ncbi:MAG TPA: acyl-CoA desaturase [Bacteroidia bacterium]|nr:acyl-CoA desaturase [Bacteroidia bacterium]